LRNRAVDAWEAAGRPESGRRPGEGEVVAHSKSLGDIERYRPFMPTPDVEGELEELSLWAGQGVSLVRETKPAAEIVREINEEASAVLHKLGGRLT
jgi:nitronate monooxygenase